MADELEIDLEQEELRVRMDESREALAQKIEQLEEKVTETVEIATASVAEATASVLETVQSATTSVSETVDSVTNAVQGTVDTVRQSVEGTVDSVKDAFDLSRQVNKHPWLMFAGAVVVGYVGENLLRGIPTGPSAGVGREQVNGSSNQSSSLNREWDGQPLVSPREIPAKGFHVNGAAINGASPAASPGWMRQLGEALAPEIAKLESLALGAMLGSVKEIVVKAVPEPIRQPLAEVIDGFTEKLGGKCIHGSLLTPHTNPMDATTSTQHAPFEFQR